MGKLGIARVYGGGGRYKEPKGAGYQRRSGLRTASTAAKPCQGDSSEFYLITGSIHTDQWGTVVLATLFNGSEQRHFRSFITNINLQESRRLQVLAKRYDVVDVFLRMVDNLEAWNVFTGGEHICAEAHSEWFTKSKDFFKWYTLRAPPVEYGGLFSDYLKKLSSTRTLREKDREAWLEIKSLKARVYKLETIINVITPKIKATNVKHKVNTTGTKNAKLEEVDKDLSQDDCVKSEKQEAEQRRLGLQLMFAEENSMKSIDHSNFTHMKLALGKCETTKRRRLVCLLAKELIPPTRVLSLGMHKTSASRVSSSTEDIDTLQINASHIQSLTIKGKFDLATILLLNVSSIVQAKLDYHTTYNFYNMGMHKHHRIELLKGLILIPHIKELKVGKFWLEVLASLKAKGFICPSNLKVVEEIDSN
nr:phospholipase-like, aminotransferase-like mobile domain protein [Tanacetum cinerariifolium]